MVAVALISPLTSVYSLLHILDLTPTSPTSPSVTPGPNSSMQNRAGRSSLADQNTLFSEFSPFTRGWTWGSIVRAPPSSSSAETGTQHRPDEPSCAASQRHAKKFSSRSRWENKQASDITADAETRRREKLVEVQGCRVWACYSGSRCQCRIVPLPVRASCQ